MKQIKYRRNRVAVLDFGSARTKMVIVTEQFEGEPCIERFSAETAMVSNLSIDGKIPYDLQHRLLNTATEFLELARSRQCTLSIAVVTDAFRRASNSDSVRALLERRVGYLNVLTPIEEGLIMHAAVALLSSAAHAAESYAVLDIGGGSVQLTWGADAGQVLSFPTGTFRLEREFQQSHTASPGEMDAMREYITSLVRTAVPDGLRVSQLVVGSTCMRSFFDSALRHVDIAPRQVQGQFAITLDMARCLLSRVRASNVGELSAFYPDNPAFVRGADKLLLNLISISELLGVETIAPTDGSISTALASLALRSGKELERLHIQGVEMSK